MHRSVKERPFASLFCTAALPLFLLLLPLLTVACVDTRRVLVEVGGHSREPVSLKGKRLWVDMNKRAASLFIEEEVASKIMHGLESRGYMQAVTFDEADYRLEFVYAVHNSQESLKSEVVGADPDRRRERLSMSTTPDTNVYEGRLILRLFSRADAINPIWVGEATSSGSGADLRHVMDYLVLAALNHLGQDISHRVSYTFKETGTLFNRTRSSSIQPDNP